MTVIGITDVSGSQIEIAKNGAFTGTGSDAANGQRRGPNKSTYGVAMTAGDNEIATMFDVNNAGGNSTAAISTEQSRASAAESTLTANVSGEVSRASAAESTLTLNLSAEVSRASAAESVELSRASAAESTLTANVSGEVSRASAAESTLTANLSGEVSRASAAESTEVSRASAAESTLTANLSAEVSRATLAERNISNGTTHFQGTIYIDANSTDNVAPASLKVAGDVAGNSFSTTSDARLKTDVEEVSGGMATVKALRPVLYNWLDGHAGINPGHKELGFLAQEVEAVLPNVVSTDASDDFHKKAVCYDRIVSLLVAAVKELDGRLALLEPRA
jgi:hypothetical protein